MSLLEKISDFRKGVNLGKHLITEDYTIGDYRNYFQENTPNFFFKAGFMVSEKTREHISYSTLANLIDKNHEIYGNVPSMIVKNSGPKYYLFGEFDGK